MKTDRSLRAGLEDRWQGLCGRLGLYGDITQASHWLLDAYAAPERAYHNLDHLAHCFAELDSVRGVCPHPDTVELALWCHDCVYDPQRKDNEERSAEWARSVLAFLGATTRLLADIEAMVMATKHIRPLPAGATAEMQFVADIDLSILGQPAERYDAYEQAIRREYHHVPDADFVRARTLLLKSFLARPTLYATLTFRARYETRARENISRSLSRLTKSAQASVASPST